MKREVFSLYFIRAWRVSLGMIASLQRFRERSVKSGKHMVSVFGNIVHAAQPVLMFSQLISAQ